MSGRVYKSGKRGRTSIKSKKGGKLPFERENVKAENPEIHYTFGEDIGRGKFSVVKKATCKRTGIVYAAKIIKFDSVSVKFAVRELDLLSSGKLNHKGLVKLHDAFCVRKYLILILDLCEGKRVFDYFSKKHSVTEEDVAGIVKQILDILDDLHSNNVVHLDLRNDSIMVNGRDVKLLDYNSARHLPNKKAGEVVDVIGAIEFCAPELLNYEPILTGSDMWSLGVLTYTLLSGLSPFYYEDEDKKLLAIQKVEWEFDSDAFEKITTEAKDFISKLFQRVPEFRMTAADALNHPWLQDEYQTARKGSIITCQDKLKETLERRYAEDEEEYIGASLVFRTYEEEEYESPEESEDED